ncbi:MAG: HAD hydrolase-like protein [Ignavibacteria bacterium]|nr:HAD hydrolase-like protein [Ignavibacteria bacterium]
MQKILLLFDIDGTLLKVDGGVSKKAFATVFEKVFKVKIDSQISFDFTGLTDLYILTKYANILNIENSILQENLDLIWYELFQQFQENCKPENIHLIEGVKEFIEEIYPLPYFTLGLLTGNFKENAYYKLSLVGLDKFFPFGAFGNEDIKRSNLHSIALERANKFFGGNFFTRQNTFVVGDSILDVNSAKANSMRTIAVSTGTTSYENLKSCEPDLLVHTLKEKNRILNYLLNG